MTRTLIQSIQEAASTILSHIETISDDEITDIFSPHELQAIDTALWEMVELTQ